MGDASSVRLAFAQEITNGTNPGADFSFMRFTRESLALAPGVVTSAEIDATRQTAASVRVNLSAAGQVEYEDSLVVPVTPSLPGTPLTGFDAWIESAMMDGWDTATSLNPKSIDVAIDTPSAGQHQLTDALTSGSFTGFSVGDGVLVSGLTNNGTIVGRIITSGTDVIVIEGNQAPNPSGVWGGAVVADSLDAACTVKHSNIRISNTKKSLAIEKQFVDLSPNQYSELLYMLVGSWSERLTPGGIFTGTFDLTGKIQDSNGTTTTGGSEVAKWGTPILQAVDHFKMKMIGDYQADATERVQEITFTLNNGVRTEPELGVLGSTDLGISTPTLTGTLVAYMSDIAFITALEDDTTSKLGWLKSDATRYRMYSVPLIRWTGGTVLAEGNDQSVLARMEWAAEPDANGNSFSLDRF